MPRPLSPEQLYWRCDPASLPFCSTAEVEDTSQVPGQARVESALKLFSDMPYTGYNLFVLGPPGVGRHSAVIAYLNERAQERPPPQDWCYVSDFDDDRRPRRLALPKGLGRVLKEEVTTFIDDCRAGLAGAFESEEYHTRSRIIEEEMNERRATAMDAVEHEAQAANIALVQTPMGVALAPIRDGEVVKPEAFEAFPLEERKAVQSQMEAIEETLRKALRKAPAWQKELRSRVRELNEETARFAVMDLRTQLKSRFTDLDEVLSYLDALAGDVVANIEMFLATQLQRQQAQHQQAPGAQATGQAASSRYQVNLLVDHADSAHAPVVYEDNPTYDRLAGAIEHRAEMGALTTDFTLIRPGALHRANGGYLILDAHKVLSYPYAWEGLKQSLRAREIRITPMERALGLISTQTLEAQSIALDVKVVLIGDRRLYYMLNTLDPEFAALFKVAADFDDQVDRSSESLAQYARLVASLVRQDQLLPFDASGVARILENAAREAGHVERLSASIANLADLAREAEYEARKAGLATVGAAEVQAAIDAASFRADRIRERMQAETLDDTLMVSTDGVEVGQINGLSVLALGGFSFGRPSRITARVSLGRGDVVDIEREVKLGGPLHSKGVLILRSFLNSRYSDEAPLALNASLVFEQSYGGVDGDSASSAELYCLLSAIAKIPLRQDLAVTGSVNQAGQVQAIGGVNEKIEGFFDLCAARGLTGEQGVLIPAANTRHLMLHRRVRDAVAAGNFNIYPIASIDEGLAVMTGLCAGERGEDGNFEPGSFNARVSERLEKFAALAQALTPGGAPGGPESNAAVHAESDPPEPVLPGPGNGDPMSRDPASGDPERGTTDGDGS
jgi:lon-related putative ATP-dependent protease